MSLPPQKFREIVFQLLFALDLGGEADIELIPFLMHCLSVTKKQVRLAYEKAEAILNVKLELDDWIEKSSKEYALARIKSVEKNVLRLALYELLFEKTLSLKIIISEAHRLTRKFGTPEGASFVNALLDHFHHAIEKRQEFDPSLSTRETETA